MKQIFRINTFETNSSSMHSLVITKEARPYDEDDKRLGYFAGSSEYELFGCCDTHYFERHPFEVLATPKDKLRYYVAHYIGYKGQTEKIEEVKEFISNITKLSKDQIKITATENKWSGYEEETYGWAGINDSGEDVFDYIEKYNITLEEFCLNPRYTVIVDGDEYQEFKKLFLKGIINLDNIAYISSGKSFWIDDEESFSLFYINRLTDDEVFNNLMEKISDYGNPYIIRIIIEDEEDEPIIPDAIEAFKVFLQALNTKLDKVVILKLKTHTKEDFEPIMEFVDKVLIES